MILMIDNYDSFTYNLYQYIGTINPNIVVRRNDEITIDEIKNMNISHIVISPGPGYPKDAGISVDIIKEFYNKIPILGVCLGHQAIGEAFGGEITHAKKLFHGKTSEVSIASCEIFNGLSERIKAARYHSLVIERKGMPNDLGIIAETKDGEIMGVKHKKYPVFGVQFHPESIIMEHGMKIIENYLKILLKGGKNERTYKEGCKRN
jgi:anthranilate synthase/aminodeoxychorismate synthase-like glutamine amidotransferase